MIASTRGRTYFDRFVVGDRFVWILIGVTAVARMIFGYVIDLPVDYPDSVAYHSAAAYLADHGLFASNVPHLPFYPAGYPIFISFLYSSFGVDPLYPVLAQGVLLAIATLFSFRFLRREFGVGLAFATVVFLCLNPSWWGMSPRLLYEPLLAACLAVGVDLVSGATRGKKPLLAGGAGLILGAGIAVQGKLILVALGCVIWLGVVGRKVLPVAILVASLCVGPLMLAYRNYRAGEGFTALSSNLGAQMLMGFNPRATGGYITDPEIPPGCPEGAGDPKNEGAFVRCTLRWAVSHPVDSAELVIRKTLYFAAPTIGPPEEGGLWMTPLDYRHALPDSLAASPSFLRADTVMRTLFALGWIALVGVGTVVLARKNRKGTALLLIPLAAFLAVTLLTTGEPRFRVPVAPFYGPLLLVGVLSVANRPKKPWAVSVEAVLGVWLRDDFSAQSKAGKSNHEGGEAEP